MSLAWGKRCRRPRRSGLVTFLYRRVTLTRFTLYNACPPGEPDVAYSRIAKSPVIPVAPDKTESPLLGSKLSSKERMTHGAAGDVERRGRSSPSGYLKSNNAAELQFERAMATENRARPREHTACYPARRGQAPGGVGARSYWELRILAASVCSKKCALGYLSLEWRKRARLSASAMPSGEHR